MYNNMRVVGLLSKISRNSSLLVSPKSSPFLKFNSTPYHPSSTHSTLSWKTCTHNARNGLLPTSIIARRFFSNALLKKHPVTNSNRRFAHWSATSLNRQRRSIFTANGVVLGLMMTNIGVLILWRVADTSFMIQNFTISVENFTSGRIHTMISYAFSHHQVGHIFNNMLCLYFFGRSIGEIFGPRYLLKLYLGGALAGSIFHLAYHAFMAHSIQDNEMQGISPTKSSALGACGAMYAIAMLHIFLFPKQTVNFEMLIPMPAYLAGMIWIGYDIWMARKGKESSGYAKVGGMMVAALSWLRIRNARRIRPF